MLTFGRHCSRLAESFPNTTEEEILAAEFLLCQGIRFAFDVRHPYRALEGAVMELKQLEDVEVRLCNPVQHSGSRLCQQYYWMDYGF